MNDVIPAKAPVMAGWLTLAGAWFLFLIPFPGVGMIGWVVNLAAFILSIVVMSKGETAQGIGQLVCSLVVSPIVYFIGLVLFVGLLGTLEHM